jgi:CubicO group peptidase (beta-lactamase class C family)
MRQALALALAIWVLGSGGWARAAEGFQWQTASPKSQGLDAKRLQAWQDDLAARRTASLLVIRRDRIVWEWYGPGHGPKKRHYTASMVKQLVAGMSLALALNDGRIGLDDPAAKYIPAWKDDAKKSKITIRHLATHCSGIDDAWVQGADYRGGINALAGWQGDFWKGRSLGQRGETVAATPNPFTVSVHQAPVVFEPGTDYRYSNPGYANLAYALTASLKDAPDKDLRALLRRRIMEPIGVQAEDWSIGYERTFVMDGLPLVATWGGGEYTPRAMAQVARLVLRKGDWDGKELIAPKWIEAMTSYGGTPLPKDHPAWALGWLSNSNGVWPRIPRDAVWGGGNGHQSLLIVPSLDLIAIRTGEQLVEQPLVTEAEWFVPIATHVLEPVVAAVTEE